jgi:hypothetical protein
LASNENSIWKRRGQLEREERNCRQAWLDKYYQTPEYKTYQMHLAILQDECETLGHVFGSHHDNGVGWEWSYCKQCSSRYDIKQYSISGGQSEDDD